MIITDSSLGEDGFRSISNKIKDTVSQLGGKVLDSDAWGKRAFAYEIDHKNDGYYEVLKFDLPQDGMSKIKQQLNLISGLVRYLVTAQE